MINIILKIAVFCFAPLCILGQDLNGLWQGHVTMEGYNGKFLYELRIEEEAGTINGYSISMTEDSITQVKFQIGGSRVGDQIILQELQQISKPPPQWCLKYAKLQIIQQNDSILLIGDWNGGGCNPGKMKLHKWQAHQEKTSLAEIPFSFMGRWTGHLDQSDRSYGFFYEMTFNPDGTGQSFIVSEGNGGSAYHHFNWTYDSIQQIAKIRETKVIKRTDPKWKWCIKSADLKMLRKGAAYQLNGDWWGQLEADNSKKGTCAPGKMYLEKPILTTTIVEKIAQKSNAYQLDMERKIKINRILEVERAQLKIGVWDNGVLDGDVLTLYVNGEKVMDKYKVSKRKAYIDVSLNEKNNFLVLHADDLGEISPNTVALSIYDGVREQIVVMSSNLEESGAILIKQIDLK